jgi:CRP/FNR family transcriptional regulator
MIADTRTRDRLLHTFPFLAAAEAPFLERLLHQAALARLETGQPVCHEGALCSVLPLVLSGSARVFKGSESGREITLYRLGPGESCVMTASCILSANPFPASAVCETEVEAAVLPAADVAAWLQDSRVWREFLFGLVADRLHRIINVVEDVVFLRMDQRLADFLLRHPLDPDDGAIHLTHQQIADDLGTSREVISRLLKDFEQRTLVSITRGRLIPLDRDTLGKIAAAR